MIIGVRVDRDAAFLHLVAKVHPTRQFLGAVNDGFIPRSRFLLDALSVSQPANVGPIRGNRIEPQVRRTGHPEAIRRDEGYPVIPQEIGKARVEPIPIANLDGELIGVRQFLQKWDQPVEKFMPVPKHAAAEKTETEKPSGPVSAREGPLP